MKEVVNKGRDDFSKYVKRYIGSIATMGWIDEEGTLTNMTGACHALMTYRNYWPSKDIVAAYSGIQENNTGIKEAERVFIEWLQFQSPFRNSFIKDTTDNALSKRVLIGDVEQPANYMTAGLMATRVFNEHPAILTCWYRAVEAGLHPTIAFAFAHHYYISNDGLMYEHFPTHTGCFTKYGESDIINFLQERMTGLSHPYKQSPDYAISTFKIWRSKNNETIKLWEDIPLLLKKACGGTTSGYQNPFAKAKKTKVEAPKYQDAFELLVPHLNKYKEIFNG